MSISNGFLHLDRISVFSRPNCKIKNPQRVEEILNHIIRGGADQLQVITDFDHTVTKQTTESGKPILSSFGMFNKCKSLPEDYSRAARAMFEKYRPIEINPNISHDDKVRHMIEWWTLSSEALK